MQIVLAHAKMPEAEFVTLAEAQGRVLMENLLADRDFPPFHRVAMDGIAIDFAAFAKGQRRFPIQAIAAAGSPKIRLSNSEHCIEIMTGAVLPEACDTVIRYEDLRVEAGVAELLLDELVQGQNIHRQGIDCLAGAVLLQPGKRMGSADIAVAATIGKTHIAVARLPRIIVISNGDELVDIGEKPLPHQIRRSNTPMLRAVLRREGVMADALHLPDDAALIQEQLAALLPKYDGILLSGGVSEGKFDYIHRSLEALGVQKCFHKVQQRPGKPFWFGVTAQGGAVFALPGNPASSFMCAHRYVLPWLAASQGSRELPQSHAVLAEEVSFRPNLSYFLQVRLTHSPDGQVLAHPLPGHGSGDLANLAVAEAFLELPVGQDVFAAGTSYPVWRFA